MSNNFDLDQIHEMFDKVKHCVWEDGGDGDGWIVSENYTVYADIFEKYETDGEKWFTEKYVVDGESITFGNNQEAIIFVKDRSMVPTFEYQGKIVEGGSIVVEIVDDKFLISNNLADQSN